MTFELGSILRILSWNLQSRSDDCKNSPEQKHLFWIRDQSVDFTIGRPCRNDIASRRSASQSGFATFRGSASWLSTEFVCFFFFPSRPALPLFCVFNSSGIMGKVAIDEENSADLLLLTDMLTCSRFLLSVLISAWSKISGWGHLTGSISIGRRTLGICGGAPSIGSPPIGATLPDGTFSKASMGALSGAGLRRCDSERGWDCVRGNTPSSGVVNSSLVLLTYP